MKKIVYVILVLSVIVILNVYLFYSNQWYASFVKSIKYWQEKKILVTDEYLNIDKQTPEQCVLNNSGILSENQNTWSLNKQNYLETSIEKPIEKIEEKKDYKNEINNVLKIFSSYKLKEKSYDEYYKIFWLTDEYPDKYLTYLDKDIELYIFTWNDFEYIYDFLNIVWEKATIKKTNTFWKNSFFINLKENDNKVRLVVDNWEVIFWLVIWKNKYPEIKKIIFSNLNK